MCTQHIMEADAKDLPSDPSLTDEPFATNPLEDRLEMEAALAVFYEDQVYQEARRAGEYPHQTRGTTMFESVMQQASGASSEHQYIPPMQLGGGNRLSMLCDGPLSMPQGNRMEEQMMREMSHTYGSSNNTQPYGIHWPHLQQPYTQTPSYSMSGAATSSRTPVESGSVLEVNVGTSIRKTLHAGHGLDTLASVADVAYEDEFGVDATSGGSAQPLRRKKVRKTLLWAPTTAPPPVGGEEVAPPATRGVGRGKINAAFVKELYASLCKCTNYTDCTYVVRDMAGGITVSPQAVNKMLIMKTHILMTHPYWNEAMWDLYGRQVFSCAMCKVYTPRKVCQCEKRGKTDHISPDKQSEYPDIKKIFHMLMNTAPAATDANGGN